MPRAHLQVLREYMSALAESRDWARKREATTDPGDRALFEVLRTKSQERAVALLAEFNEVVRGETRSFPVKSTG